MANVHSFKVATTLAAYRCVAATGAMTVGYPADNQTIPIGITMDTVRDINQAIPVAVAGSIAKLQFAASVAAGSLIQSNSSGQGTALVLHNTTTALTLASAYVGVLIGGAASTNSVLDVLVMPGLDLE